MVELAGTRVRLREFGADDLDPSMRIVGDDRVTRWLSFDTLSREQQAQRLAETIERAGQTPRTEYYLAVVALPGDELIGFARLGLGGVKAAKIGGAIAAEHWSHGYAIDAACALITYGFSVLALHRITAAVGPDNTASAAVLNRLGFTYEGRLRDHVFTNGSWRDSDLYSLLAHEWSQPSR